VDVPLPVIVAPTGRGGVAATVSAVLPHLGEVLRVGIGGGPASPARWARALRAGRAGRVVHLHSSFRPKALLRDVALASALSAAGRPVVLQLHGTSRALAERLPSPAWRALAALGDAGVVSSVDPWLVAELRRRGVRAEPVTVAIALEELPDARAPEPGAVLFLGRLVEGKGLRALLAAAAGWEGTARLWVAGDGPLASEVARARGPVTAVGWLGPHARRDWLARASVVVLPSASEGAPLAVAEAVASGVPVVASGGEGVRALVGGAGIVLDDPEPGAIDRAVRAVLASPPDVTADAERVRAACAPRRVAGTWREAWGRAEARRHGR
jgi:glycosyltransferase involved in cell wall biosynthesis